jgi:hypothetical protein
MQAEFFYCSFSSHNSEPTSPSKLNLVLETGLKLEGDREGGRLQKMYINKSLPPS